MSTEPGRFRPGTLLLCIVAFVLAAWWAYLYSGSEQPEPTRSTVPCALCEVPPVPTEVEP